LIPFAEIDHSLIFFSIFLTIAITLYRTLKLLVAIGALVCACVFVAIDGHFWLGETFLPQGANPQIATVALMALTTAVILLGLCFKRWRSLDRIMIGLASASVLVTFALFHYVLVQQVLPAWAKDAAWGNSYLLPAPIEGFKHECTLSGLLCWNGNDIAAGTLPAAYIQQVEGLYRFYQDHKPEGEVGHGFGVFNDLGQDGVSVVLFHQAGEDVRVIVDSKVGLRIHAKVRDLFYLMATVAHWVWLFGALSLIGFHRMRFKRSSRAH
jgi:4-amino-4-deoxy-L-arabinose transferase-like glycosyltransferase